MHGNLSSDSNGKLTQGRCAAYRKSKNEVAVQLEAELVTDHARCMSLPPVHLGLLCFTRRLSGETLPKRRAAACCFADRK